VKVTCDNCGTASAIQDPVEPSPFGKLTWFCGTCSTYNDVDNPLGDDMVTTEADLFPPGAAFIPAGTRITKETAAALSAPAEAEEEA
jgi:hypothetical protein